MGTLTFHHVHFLEEDVYDGDYPRDNITSEVHDEINASDAARLLIREGLSFAATGNDWAADPDGTRIVNYATGQRVETTGTLSDFPDRVVRAIIEKVG